MSGKILNLLERRRFEFSYLTGSTSQGVTIAPMIDVCGYGYVALYARVHARSMASGQSLNFNVYNILPSDEDAREFVETDSTGAPISRDVLKCLHLGAIRKTGSYGDSSLKPCDILCRGQPLATHERIEMMRHLRGKIVRNKNDILP